MNSAPQHPYFSGGPAWPLTSLAAIPNVASDVKSALKDIAPGPSKVTHSSASYGWQGFLVEKHLCSPGERLPAVTDRHVISLLTGRAARFQYGSAGVPCGFSVESPGSMTIIPTGTVPGVRLHDPAEFTHCALEDQFIRGVRNEMEPCPSGQPVLRMGVRDTGIQRLLDLLVQELQVDVPTGRLYVESLAFALASRYLLCGSKCESKSKSKTSPLPQRILNRVREKIEESLDHDISLAALAEESGYSRAHFLRMFREAMGMTPHQYVLDVRLRHAQEWLRKKDPALIDIAALCGFSSQSHMTNVFRKRLGVTPGEFRRTA
jgi:AraC family transcriptional regulator